MSLGLVVLVHIYTILSRSNPYIRLFFSFCLFFGFETRHTFQTSFAELWNSIPFRTVLLDPPSSRSLRPSVRSSACRPWRSTYTYSGPISLCSSSSPCLGDFTFLSFPFTQFLTKSMGTVFTKVLENLVSSIQGQRCSCRMPFRPLPIDCWRTSRVPLSLLVNFFLQDVGTTQVHHRL